MTKSKRTGVYVCRGCAIGDCLDTDALMAVAQDSDGVAVTRTSGAFCLEDSRLIAEDVATQELDAVVVAACSPRVNSQVFKFPPSVVGRVNLREQVAWSHAPMEAATQDLAVDLLRMGMASVQHADPPMAYTQDHERSVLVVGAGPAGLSAALAAAEAGYAVTLVDQDPQPGGFLRHIHRRYPTCSNALDSLQEVDLDRIVAAVRSNPNLTLRTSTTVTQVDGQPGRFRVELISDGHSEQLIAGAIVLATGFEPVGSEHFAAYGLGSLDNVVTSFQMEQMAAQAGICRPSDDQLVRRVAILACDGANDTANLPYAGSVLSMVALKQAVYVRDRNPESEVFIVYQDMQTPGLDELYYRFVQELQGVYFVRGQVSQIVQGADATVSVTVAESVLARDIIIDVDLAVLNVGMVPRAQSQGSAGAGLNLQYLQGDSLPTHRAGFVDSNFLCFPFETRRTGIYAAGTVHRLQDISACQRDGAAAALKAIQVVERAAQGEAVHPRVGDLGYPRFFMQKCTACGRCTQECPFGALELDDLRHPNLNPNRCRRCGICMGACPVQVISFPDYSVEMLSQMQKVVDLPEDDDKPRILVFACENDAYPALDMVGINRLEYPAHFRVIPVRCLGSVNSVVVADAVQRGYDGVALLGCRSGEDYQCHFIQGSGLLGVRMENVRETLGRMALEEDRVQVLETSIADARRLPGVLAELATTIIALGPNPMKGF